MSIFDDNNYIQITKDDISDALQSSGRFDSRIQKRAFANVLGARIGIKLLSSLDIKADNYNSIYTIPSILRDMDISDIRTDNNVTVDIRIVQDENHLCIPKAQYDYKIVPDIFVFVRITPDLSAATFIGAIAPDEVDKSVELDGYYFISKETLYNEASLQKAIKSGKPASNVHLSENDIIRAQSMLVNFIDGDVINNEKHYMYEALRDSDELRKFFRDFEQFELISTDLAHTEEILSDSVLDVLGAQEIYKNEPYNSNFASEIDLDELAVETAADFVEDFIDDSKEDEMQYNNDIIEGEFKELADDTPVEEAGELEALPTDEELASFADNLQDYTETNDVLEPLEEFSAVSSGFEGFEGLDASSNIPEINEFEVIDNIEQTAEKALDLISDNSNKTDDNNDSFSEFSDYQQAENINPENNSNIVDENSNNFSEFTDFQAFEELTPENDININSIDINDTDNFEILEETNANISQDNNSFENFEITETDDLSDLSVQEDFSEINQNIQDAELQDFDMQNSLSDTELQPEDYLAPQLDLEEVTDVTLDDFDTLKPNEETALNTNEVSDVDSINQPLEFNESENIGTIEDLENFELPVDMSLPNLEYDENLDKLGENSQTDIVGNVSDNTEVTEDIPQTLDDISQNVTFNEEGNIEEVVTDIEEIIAEENITDEIQDVHDESHSSTEHPDDDMSGLEEFTPDMAAAYEQANPQVFGNSANINIQDPVALEYNESDFSLTDDLPQLDNLEQLTPLEQSPDLLENTPKLSEDPIPTDIPVLESSTEFPIEQSVSLEDMPALPELDTLYGMNDLTSDFGSEFGAQMETLQDDLTANEEPETYAPNTTAEQDYTNNSYSEMEVYRPEADTSFEDVSSNVYEAPLQEETYSFNTNSDDIGLSFDDMTSQSNTASNTEISDINLDDYDSDDDEFGDINLADNSSYPDASEVDIDGINIDDIDINNIDINNIDINNIDMSEFDVNDLSSIDNIPDATQQSQAENVEFAQNQAPEGEYVPDFNQNDESTINALYNENAQNQNPGEAMDQSFDQNNVNPQQQKAPKAKGQQKTSPLLGILLILLIGAFGFMKKDLILEKLNAQKGVNYEQDQNMPVEGETQEDIEDAKLLNEDGTPQEDAQGQEQMPVGAIPGEAGGPQDAASMEQSLHQKGSMANDIPRVKEQQLPSSTPVPIATNSIKRLYWEIPQDLTYNDGIVNYLKTVGKTMKFAIQSDLLNITEMPYSNKMIVEIEIKKDGSVGDVNTTVSSESKQIDTIVLQSVKAAMKYVKAPTSEFKNDSYRFSLIINF